MSVPHMVWRTHGRKTVVGGGYDTEPPKKYGTHCHWKQSLMSGPERQLKRLGQNQAPGLSRNFDTHGR